MRSERGITLTSLIVYVIAMLSVVTIITVVTGYFYKNIDIEKDSSTYTTEFSRLQSYFSKEAQKTSNSFTIGATNTNGIQNYIKFSDGTQYTYVKNNNAIYKNKIKIASNVEKCTFSQSGKMLNMNITIKGQKRILKYSFSG